jgi:hypothetical protein
VLGLTSGPHRRAGLFTLSDATDRSGMAAIAIDGRREPIRACMRASAEFKTGGHRVIDYLLSPVEQAVKEDGRER